jgi:hypothetical protein
MNQRLTLTIFLFLVLALPGFAREALVLPIEMPGHYSPLDSQALTQKLQQRLAKLAPDAKLQVATAAELTAYQYQAGSDLPPTLETAGKICRAYDSKHTVWISIAFQPSFDKDTNTLAVAGAARLWVYDRDQKKVVLDQPLSLVRTGQIADISDREKSRSTARELAAGCVDDLGTQIASISDQRAAQARQRTASWNTEAPPVASYRPSNAYKDMEMLVKRYKRAARDNNFVDLTQSETDMSRLWVTMSADDRAAVSKTYPGVKQLMETPAVGGGYYYWPYRY